MPIRAAARRVSSLRNDAEADVSTPKLKVDSKVPTSQQQNVEDLLVPLASEVGQGQSAKLDRDGRLQVDRWTQPQHEPAQRTTEDEQRSANWLLLQPQMYFSFLANYGEDRKIPVNSAAVEPLFYAFGNIHTKRSNRFVHDRVHNIALIKSMLPPKPRPAKQAEGSQYLGRPNRSAVNEETAAAEYKQAEADTMREYVDGPQDLLLQEEQVTDIVNEYDSQLRDDEEDDEEYDDIAPDLDPEDSAEIPIANSAS
ncbi:hypothetical protein ABBQ32_009778 [Trebouxia sp. C0010 RCD-2024]